LRPQLKPWRALWLLLSSLLLVSFPSVRALTSGADAGELEVTGPDLLVEARVDSTFDIRLSPAEKIDSPLTVDDVIKTGVSEGVVLGDPTSAHVQFALLTSETYGMQSVPVWVVDFEGVCVPNLGPEGNGGGACVDDNLTVILDGTSGAWITSYAIRG
jgi:hypothetical protein